MERLKFMIGSWDIEPYRMDDNGVWVESPVPKQTEIHPFFGEAYLQEEVGFWDGEKAIRFFIMWSYDPFRQVYRMLICDDQEGLMDLLEGNFDGNTITVSNLKTGTETIEPDGSRSFIRLASTKTSEDRFTDELSYSVDGGESWNPYYRAIHNRNR